MYCGRSESEKSFAPLNTWRPEALSTPPAMHIFVDCPASSTWMAHHVVPTRSYALLVTTFHGRH